MAQAATTEATIADAWSGRIRDYFAIADQWDFDAFHAYLSPDLRFRFANNEPINGLEEMIAFSRQFRPQVKSVRHRLDRFYTDIGGRTVAVEGEVTYTRLDDQSRAYPAAVIVEFDDNELISDYRVFVDLSTLLS